MSKKMTIAFEIEDDNSEMLDKLFESFKEQTSVDGLKVYAMSHKCLFEQIEEIEDILDSSVCYDDVGYDVSCILGKE